MRRKNTVGPDVDLDAEDVTLPSGRRYTQADAEADEQFFRDKTLPGRPSLAGGVSPQVSFRVPQSVKDELTRIAKARTARRPRSPGRPSPSTSTDTAALELRLRHRLCFARRVEAPRDRA